MGNPPNAFESPSVLGSSLHRLYGSKGPAENDPVECWPSAPKPSLADPAEATLELTESLLEAVFEISEFDPLPHLDFRDDDFGLGLTTSTPHYPAPTKQPPARPGSVPAAAPPQSAMDRRKLPRRESECLVSVCLCRSEERLTSERITWMLYASKLKGRLIDVSMSGLAFHLPESLPAGSRILLRIHNRTIDKQVDTQAEVLRSRAASDGGWELVCRFQKNLTFEQIHTVGRSLFAATIV